MKNPPILVAVLGFFAALAGFSFVFFGFRLLGFDWFGVLGDLPAFEHVGLWGWLAIATGFVWLLAAFGLWALQPWARLFAMIMAGIALFEAVLAFFQFPGTGVGLAMAIMPALILWYLSTSDVKQAFGLETAPSAPEPPAASATEATTAGSRAAVAPVAAAAVATAAVDSRADRPSATAAPIVAAAAAAADSPANVAEMAPPAPHVRIDEVEGIGPAYSEKLAAIGIVTTADLLAAGSTRAGRARIADQTDISHTLIREWVDKADLMRVPGVGTQYSDLLELAGVDSPAELSHRNAANLAQTFQDAVAARPGTVRRIPTETEIAGWIETAAKLPGVVEH